jgi:small subunit ribosomal protein S17e
VRRKVLRPPNLRLVGGGVATECARPSDGTHERAHNICILFLQGVRTKTVKKSARTIVEKYYTRLTTDFHTNKRLVDDVAILPSKRMRNKIAGYTTHLMRRIAKGPVRGISLKLQEEERERRLDFVPEVSALDQETIQIDPDTRDLLESLGYSSLNGVAVNQTHSIRD